MKRFLTPIYASVTKESITKEDLMMMMTMMMMMMMIEKRRMNYAVYSNKN